MSERVPVEPAEPRPEQVPERMRRYLDRHGWDLTDDEATWRAYQRRQMALEYQDDLWQEAPAVDGV